jgi:hypothetical protein
VMMNATAVPSKRSSLERRLDGLIGIIFCILAALCIVGAVGSVICLNTVSDPTLILTLTPQPSDEFATCVQPAACRAGCLRHKWLRQSSASVNPPEIHSTVRPRSYMFASALTLGHRRFLMEVSTQSVHHSGRRMTGTCSSVRRTRAPTTGACSTRPPRSWLGSSASSPSSSCTRRSSRSRSTSPST